MESLRGRKSEEEIQKRDFQIKKLPAEKKSLNERKMLLNARAWHRASESDVAGLRGRKRSINFDVKRLRSAL